MTKPSFEIVMQPHPDRGSRIETLKKLGFGWADIEDEQYWIDQVAALDRDVYEELQHASVTLWRVFDKAVRYIHGNHGLYELIGIPPILWEMVDGTPLPEPGLISRYARFDFAIDQDSTIKLLELNADTPTGYVEASIVTPWLCEEAGLFSPNTSMKELVAAAWDIERPDTAVCVAYGEHMEDSGTIEALVRHSGLDVKCRDCLELYVDDGELKDGDGRVIKRMFALYPKEWMAVDEGGDALAYSVESGNLTLFNSPPSILLQTKGLMAVVWGLYELGQVFDEEERKAIGQYLLPTYNKPVFDGSYVSKSMFGREGGSVRMFDDAGGLELEDRDGYDTSLLFPTVYQKRAKLARVNTSRGEQHLLTGMFVINGQPCGLLGRAGGPITGNASHFIAIGVKNK
ncbi:glutathionylspermidine synthase family protein [Paenibacillus sp. LHD-117]|uniref:glutathionylspermidine synthase family protein n=1 Tax=Paenibacillus sp. LHD-117 TaxID=3071412 RepID=UPI0027DF5516|nr:glutathionylspermidine synthase family protein [Paenibacillus sp. LHD-117]MDQ6420024.1 glutathionylspermidine synthase family protein [Paenibacillus sp. LHD-117]